MTSGQLADLLNAAFHAWGVTAHATADATQALAVAIETGDEHLRVARTGSASDAPAWRITRADAPHAPLDECRSSVTLHAALRQHLDAAFSPARAIIGVRPPAP